MYHGLLKKDTARKVKVGPFVNYQDGVTPVTSMVLGSVACRIHKGEGAGSLLTLTAPGGGGNEFGHDSDGYWWLQLTADDVDTGGELKVTFRDDDGFLPLDVDRFVVPAGVYDFLTAHTGDFLNAATRDGLITALFARDGFTAGAGDVTFEDALRWWIAFMKGKVRRVGADPLTYAIYDQDGATELFRLSQDQDGREEA